MTVAGTRRSFRFGAGEWLAIGAAVAYAATNVLTRVASVEGDPLAGTALRLIPITIISLGMMVVRRKQVLQVFAWREDFLGWRTIGWLLVFALVVSPIAQLVLFLSLRFGGVLVAAPIFSTFTLFGALFAIPILGQAFNRYIGVGIVAGLVGIALVSIGQYRGIPISDQWPLGAFFALLAGITWGLSSNISSYLLRRGLDIFTMIGIISVGTMAVLALVLVALGRAESLIQYPASSFSPLMWAGLANGAAQILLFAALGRTTVASAGTIKTLDVILAAIIAIAFLGEIINFLMALGTVLIVSSVVLVQLSRGSEEQPEPQAGEATAEVMT